MFVFRLKWRTAVEQNVKVGEEFISLHEKEMYFSSK